MQLSAAGGLPPVGWVWRRSAGGGRGPPTNGRGEAGASCTGARTEWQTARTGTVDSARTDWQTARTRDPTTQQACTTPRCSPRGWFTCPSLHRLLRDPQVLLGGDGAGAALLLPGRAAGLSGHGDRPGD